MSTTSLTIAAGGQTLVLSAVTVAGQSVTVWSDAAQTSEVTLPTWVTGDTTLWLPDIAGRGAASLAQLDGTPVGTAVFDVAIGHEATIDPASTDPQQAADLSTPLWDDLRVSVSNARPGSSPPLYAAFRDGVFGYAFSATQTNDVYFDVQLPHSWIPGTTIEPHVHWSPGNSADTGTVRWEYEYTHANYGAAFGASTTLTVDQAATGAYAHQIASFPVIDTTGWQVSAVMVCRLSRIGGNAADTFTGTAFALSVDLHIRTLGAGSLTEYPS